jgi:predicted dehydrogenase
MSVKWAVLGSCGIAKRRTIPEGIISAPNAELVAIYDVAAKANEELATELGVRAATSEADLLAEDIDAVYIATPASLHYQQVLAAAKAGKHILCEKPLGMNNDEAMQMIAACKDAGVQLGTAFMMRFHSQHQAALKMIQEGKLGKCVYGRAQLSCWYPLMEGNWRQDPAKGGGGSLMDMGGHCIDLLEMFFGDVKKVSCFINNTVHEYKAEDSAVAMLFFENGAMATVDTFFCMPDASSKNVLELYGSKGSILAKGTIGQGEAGEMVAFLEDSDTSYDAQQSRSADEGIKISPSPVNMYLSEIEEFSQAILEGRKTSLSAEVGLRSQKILTACYESAKTGVVVEL